MLIRGAGKIHGLGLGQGQEAALGDNAARIGIGRLGPGQVITRPAIDGLTAHARPKPAAPKNHDR